VDPLYSEGNTWTGSITVRITMRTLGRLVFLVPLLFAVRATVAHADSIAVGDRISFEKVEGTTTGGGPFVGTIVGTTDSFLTFCLQSERPLDFGPEYTIAGITDYAYWEDDNRGGDTITGRDPISSQTAWLYTQFRNGTLAGYNGTTGAMDSLQWAIWVLEDEEPSVPAGAWRPLALQFINEANQAVANGFTGLGDVRVLNLVSWDGVDIQDQLALVTTPEPPTIALLLCGLFGLAVTRRRWLPAVTTR
jgi:hypothetical protein